MVHGTTCDETRQRRLEQLRQQCQQTVRNKPQVGVADEHLLRVRLDDKTGPFLHCWKRAVALAIKKEGLREKQRQRFQMREYLQQVRQRPGALNTRQSSILDYFGASGREERGDVASQGYELDQRESLCQIQVMEQRELGPPIDRPPDDT